jgi:hypothetical protein
MLAERADSLQCRDDEVGTDVVDSASIMMHSNTLVSAMDFSPFQNGERPWVVCVSCRCC